MSLKKILFNLICTILLLTSTTLTAQPFFTVGTTYSTHTAFAKYDFSYAFPFGKQKMENFLLRPTLGYGYHFDMNHKWSYEPGISFAELSSLQITEKPRQKFFVYAVSLNQFIEYKATPWLSVGFSPTVYFVVWAGHYVQAINNDEKFVHWNKHHKSNYAVFSLIPRISFHLNKHWSINMTYRNDLTPFGYLKPFNFPVYGYGVGLNLKYLW